MADLLSVVAAVEASYTLAKELYTYVEKFVRFQAEVGRLSLRFEDDNMVLSRFITFFQKEEDQIHEDDKKWLKKLFLQLEEDLRKTQHKIRTYLKGRILDRTMWPFLRKYLISAEKDLAHWVRRLNGRFVVLPDDLKQSMIDMVTSASYKQRKHPMSGLIASSKMKQAKSALANMASEQLLHLKQDEPERDNTETTPKYYRTDEVVVLNEIIHKKSENDKMMLEVAKLTYVLQNADHAQAHIPRALFFFSRGDTVVTEYGIVYSWPEDVIQDEQQSLKQLVRQKAAHGGAPLNQRIRIAQEIAVAVAYVHEVGWVHKAIRSRNLMVTYHYGDVPSPKGLGHVNLVGFNLARCGGWRSYGSSDSGWKNAIYHHPDRQVRAKPTKEPQVNLSSKSSETLVPSVEDSKTGVYFEEKHNEYSVGVVLLELGLWTDLETYGDCLKSARPKERHEFMTNLAEELPLIVGEKYENLGLRCLAVDITKVSIKGWRSLKNSSCKQEPGLLISTRKRRIIFRTMKRDYILQCHFIPAFFQIISFQVWNVKYPIRRITLSPLDT